MANGPVVIGGHVQGGGQGTGPGVTLDSGKPPGWYSGPADPTDFATGPRLGRGLRVRLTRIKGRTPKGILTRRLYLPVVLNEMTVEETAEFAEYTTHSKGEFAVPRQGGKHARTLRDLPFEMLTLDWEADWLIEYRNPKKVQHELDHIIRSKEPVMLLALVHAGHRQPVEFRGAVTLRRTARTLRPGEADTRYWQLEFKEDRELTSRRLATKKGKGDTDLPTRHRLNAGTNLEGVSKRYYGTTAHWRLIREENNLGHWGPRTPLVQHRRFKVGDFIKVPALTRGAGPGVSDPVPTRPSRHPVRSF